MSKQYSKSELEKKSINFFKENKDVKKVFYTTDGQPFLMENRADIHAKNAKLDVFGFENPNEKKAVESESNEIDIDSSAPVLIGAISILSDVEKLKLFLSQESEGKKRKTVIEAIEKRIAELEAKSESQPNKNEE